MLDFLNFSGSGKQDNSDNWPLKDNLRYNFLISNENVVIVEMGDNVISVFLRLDILPKSTKRIQIFSRGSWTPLILILPVNMVSHTRPQMSSIPLNALFSIELEKIKENEIIQRLARAELWFPLEIRSDYIDFRTKGSNLPCKSHIFTPKKLKTYRKIYLLSFEKKRKLQETQELLAQIKNSFRAFEERYILEGNQIYNSESLKEANRISDLIMRYMQRNKNNMDKEIEEIQFVLYSYIYKYNEIQKSRAKNKKIA